MQEYSASWAQMGDDSGSAWEAAEDRRARRRAALHGCGLLDAPAEERFDRQTRLTCRLLHVPVAAISLVDADRQFLLSAQGLPEPWASLRQTPLSHSFCRLVVEAEMPLAVEDARRDPRVQGHPAVADLGVVAYLAVPLALPDGCVIGSLCAIDGEPRGWSLDDQQALADLGATVMAEFAAVLRLGELRRTGAALHEREARLRSILETVPDAMMIFDEVGTIESFSAAAEHLFGYPAEEALGRNVSALVPSLDRCAAGAGEHGAAGMGCVVAGWRKDGSSFPVEITLGETRVGGRRLLTGFARDLTERQAAEARLQELQARLLHVSRLSAAGEMASALAHELNQPLTAAASAVRAAQRMLARLPGDATAPAEVREAMDLAAGQALRAGQIVRRLRSFVARGGEADTRLEDLATLTEEASALALVGARERGVHVELRFDPRLPRVVVDRIQIQQVLLNLIRNALEAMTQETQDAAGPRRRELTVTASAACAGMVEVAVADTGPGLAPGLAGRLFGSFASTKPGGLGMGLSICRSIIEAHGGRLWAGPNPGGGSLFGFTLRAASPDEATM